MDDGQGVPFLEALDSAARRAIDRMGTIRTFAAGASILTEGELAGRVGIIREGLVKLTATQPDGHLSVLALRGNGELLGELSALDGRPRLANADALVRCEVQFLSTDDFIALLTEHSSASFAVIRTLTARLRESDEHRMQFGSEGVPQRLSRLLLQLADSHGEIAEDYSIVISLPFTQEDMANAVSASRDAVARALRDWRKRGIVTTGRRRIVVVDPSALSRLNLY